MKKTTVEYYCDLCGKKLLGRGENYTNQGYSINEIGKYTYELCKNCQDAFDNWIETRKSEAITSMPWENLNPPPKIPEKNMLPESEKCTTCRYYTSEGKADKGKCHIISKEIQMGELLCCNLWRYKFDTSIQAGDLCFYKESPQELIVVTKVYPEDGFFHGFYTDGQPVVDGKLELLKKTGHVYPAILNILRDMGVREDEQYTPFK